VVVVAYFILVSHLQCKVDLLMLGLANTCALCVSSMSHGEHSWDDVSIPGAAANDDVSSSSIQT